MFEKSSKFFFARVLSGEELCTTVHSCASLNALHATGKPKLAQETEAPALLGSPYIRVVKDILYDVNLRMAQPLPTIKTGRTAQMCDLPF